jgi:hypothetical protein
VGKPLRGCPPSTSHTLYRLLGRALEADAAYHPHDRADSARFMTSRSAPQKAPKVVDLAVPGLPGEAPGGAEPIPAAYWRAFGLLAFTMNRFIVDHIVRSARQFDNDTEAMILFGVLAHLNVAHLMPPGVGPAEVLDDRGSVPDAQPNLRPVRLRDLTQVTGRPRETVRRKLERMEQQGRVKRVDGGYVLDVASVDEPMRVLTANGVRRFVQTASIIETLLKQSGEALAPPAHP